MLALSGNIHVYIHVYIHTYIHTTYIYAYMHTHIHTYIHKSHHQYVQEEIMSDYDRGAEVVSTDLWTCSLALRGTCAQ